MVVPSDCVLCGRNRTCITSIDDSPFNGVCWECGKNIQPVSDSEPLILDGASVAAHSKGGSHE